MNKVSSVIVSYDPTNGEGKAILLIGRKTPRQAVQVINAYQGEEAVKLWKKLTVEGAKK